MKTVTIAYAKYRDLSIEKNRNNPLISALPPKLDPKRLRRLIEVNPSCPDIELLSKEERIVAAKQIRHTLVPTAIFVEFYHSIYHLIEAGYEYRNPLDPRVVAWSYDVADPDISISELSDRHEICRLGGDTTTEHLFFSGLSGLGKSKVKISVMHAAFPQFIIHNLSNFDEIQIVYLNIEMPHDGTRSTLLKNILKAFDEALASVEKTDFLKMAQPTLSRSATIGSMESFVQDLCVKYHVGIITIDEFQNINVASKNDFDKMRQLFDSMSNELHVPFVKIGTTDSLKQFGNRLRHGRRAGEALELMPYARSKKVVVENSSGVSMGEEFSKKPTNQGRDWNNLIKALFSYQVVKHPIELNVRWDEELYKLSCGIPYVLFTLWQEAQVDAIRSGKETLTLHRLNIVYNKRFKLIRSALAALRKNKIGQFQDLLNISQLIDKGNHDVALKHLSRFANEESFSGAAALQILQVVEELESASSLKPNEQALLNSVKAKLTHRAQPVLAGQTIPHEDRKF